MRFTKAIDYIGNECFVNLAFVEKLSILWE
jgi:hypothetical protein